MKQPLIKNRRQMLVGSAASLVTTVFVSGIMPAGPAHADEAANDAELHIERMILSAKSLLDIDNGDPQARAMSVATLLDTYFDFPGITRFSSGQYWRAANAAEREEYEKALREVIISTVVRNFDQLKGLEYAHKVSTRKGNKLVLVTGEFSDATGVRPPVTVNWRVTTLPDKPPLVLDIEVQNISMLVTQKQENIAIIRQNKGNFSALIEAMREKNAE